MQYIFIISSFMHENVINPFRFLNEKNILNIVNVYTEHVLNDKLTFSITFLSVNKASVNLFSVNRDKNIRAQGLFIFHNTRNLRHS